MTTTPPPPPPGTGYPPPGGPGYPPPGGPGRYDGSGRPGPVPGPPPGRPGGPSGTDAFFDTVRRSGIARSPERWVGGVAGGLAARAGLDPLLVRGAFVLAAFLGGLGFVAYAVGWALLPEHADGRIHLQELFRGRFDVAILGAFLVLAIGISTPDRWVPFWGSGWGSGDWWSGLLWAGAIVLVVVLVTGLRRDARPGPGAPAAPYPPTAPPGPTSSTAAAASSASPATSTEGPDMDTTAPYPTAAAQTPPPPSSTATTEPLGTTTTGGPYAPTGPAGPGSGYGSGGYGSGGYGSGGYGSGGYGGYGGGYGGPTRPVPSTPATPPVPPRPPTPGPGATTVGVVLGLGLLTLAALWYARRIDVFDGPPLLTAAAVTVVLAGLGIIVAGLRGRTSGSLGALAIVTVLVAAPAAAVERADWEWNGTNAGLGEVRSTPVTVGEAERGYSVGAGEARIDLTDVPLDEGLVEVPVSVGAGDVVVVVPEDAAVVAEVRVFAGEVTWLGERVASGVGRHQETYESPAVQDGADPQISLDISVGAGQVRVIEGS
ncbi:PspC domain-containing protein [Cellulomonas carbonis]|uniref:PspC domain-containing protein n=1 Tax=Cellulomonas carbonis TaxID=1386092 RepID=UPI000A657F83|nr:PspC domain-containing protein [Cellulomonas carbonis]